MLYHVPMFFLILTPTFWRILKLAETKVFS